VGAKRSPYNNSKIVSKLNPEQYERLRREAKSPYRGLRIFIYIALAGSGFIGAVVFFARLIAGNGDLESNLGNFALQIGVLALMVWLYRIDRSKT
jgi:Low psii accumulation1 / Rep27